MSAIYCGIIPTMAVGELMTSGKRREPAGFLTGPVRVQLSEKALVAGGSKNGQFIFELPVFLKQQILFDFNFLAGSV